MNKFAFAVAAAGLMTLAACNKAEEANVADANNTAEVVTEDVNAVDANAVAADANAVAADANAVAADANAVAADANAVAGNAAAAE